MHRYPYASLALAAALTCLAGTARASAPAGVWSLVDEVTLEPDGDNPTLVRIDGVFMVANVPPDFADYSGYSVPQSGYMYYSCAEKQLAVCVMEWNDLLGVAGTQDNCRGWGSNQLPDNGSVRAPQDPAQDPDEYPIAQGVSPGFSPCEALRKWQMEHADETTTGEPGTGGDTEQSSTTQATGEPGTTAAETTGGAPNPTTQGTTGPATTGTEPTTTTASPTTGDAPASETGALTGATGSVTSETGGAPIDDGGDKGCACNSGGGGSAALLGLALLGLMRRRRCG